MATTKQSKSSSDDGAILHEALDTGLQIGEQSLIMQLQEWTERQGSHLWIPTEKHMKSFAAATEKPEPPTTSK